MKSAFKILIPLLLLIFALTALAACTSGNGNVGDTTVAETTAAETEVTTNSDTQPEATTVGETTAEETSAEETTVFNQGVVTYTSETKTTGYKEYPDDKIGKAMGPLNEGVATLFDESFDDGDNICGGKAITRSSGQTGVVDGRLCVPYNGSSGVGGLWTTWCPNVDTNFTDYKQIQLSGTMEIVGGSSCTATGLIGCFVDNYTFSIADNYGDGIWLAFLKDPSAICVLGSDQAHWGWSTGGNVTVPVANNALEGQFAFDIVCTPDKTTYVYINSQLALSVTLANSKITVFDDAGTQVYTEAYNMSSATGSHFSIFGHGGGLMIDDMQVYGATHNTEKTETVVTATPCDGQKLGLDITDKQDLVGICYTMWFNAILGNGSDKVTSANNVSELLEKYEFSSTYGFGTKGDQHNALNQFHYWAEPAQGYYRSTDKDAARNNLTLLYNAGVNFLILDYTYASAPGYAPGTGTWATYIEGPMTVLLNTIMEMRAEGLGTPYVVMWMNNQSLFEQVYNKFYNVEKWKDCFVYWNDKPFIMEWNYHSSETDKFTVRAMYGLQGKAATGQWTYLEVNNGKKTVSYGADGNAEHISVAVATQETYMSEASAHGRDGGAFWYRQWKNAFKYHPKIVSVTWWNEWCAQLYDVGQSGSHMYIFTDNFNQEYSRDIEPMKGGHGDRYYKWLCEYIRAYRAGEECPELVESAAQ